MSAASRAAIIHAARETLLLLDRALEERDWNRVRLARKCSAAASEAISAAIEEPTLEEQFAMLSLNEPGSQSTMTTSPITSSAGEAENDDAESRELFSEACKVKRRKLA